jgi:hypothetical protein
LWWVFKRPVCWLNFNNRCVEKDIVLIFLCLFAINYPDLTGWNIVRSWREEVEMDTWKTASQLITEIIK